MTSYSSASRAKCLVCSATGARESIEKPAFLSPAGAPWLVEYDLSDLDGEVWRRKLTGRTWDLWRYRELLPIQNFDARSSLGEGGTPLIPLRRLAPEGVRVWVKEEGGNPTGSFKARGLTMAVNRARELGAPGVQLASAGNAALALSAYAAACSLSCRVAVPHDTPKTVVDRCRQFGAEVISGGGTLVESAAELGRRGGDFWDLSTLKEPYRVEGKKTMGLELAEQFRWDLPDWILYPTGGGTGIVGMHKAFDELRSLGLLPARQPHFAVVQMQGCAPIVKAFHEGKERAEPWSAPDTRVYGLRVPVAVGDFLILRAVRSSRGAAITIDEESIEGMQVRAAREEGLLCGPEGAATLLALHQLAGAGTIESGQRVVVFQTGHPANYV